MQACVIMHNMIIEDERDAPVHDNHPFDFQGPLAELNEVPAEFAAFIAMHQEIRDATIHGELRQDLVEHLWSLKGNL